MYEPQQNMTNFNHLASGVMSEDGRHWPYSGSSNATVEVEAQGLDLGAGYNSDSGLVSKQPKPRRYPQDILKRNQRLLLKRALNKIGNPVDKSNVEEKTIWERLSIKGLMDKIDHLFSIYPLTNKKILE